jgi:tripartite-type tricarboxylate transporter receptor subunit TctC
MNVKKAITVAGAVVTALVMSVATAQEYPQRPIRMLLALPPGASVDALARLIGMRMSERLGQSVVVDNRPGGHMVIASQEVARAPGDGYTLYFTMDVPLVANQFLMSKLPYSPEKDFAPVGLLAEAYMVLTAHPKVPAKNLKELIAYAKANPGKLSFGAGVLPAQLAGEMLKLATGSDIVYVPFKGGGPTQQAVLGGVVDLAITDITPVLPYLGNKLNGIGAISGQRLPLAPNVPTMAEQGFPELDIPNWIGIVAPASTPLPIRRRLNEEMVHAMNDPAVRDKVVSFGLVPAPGSIDEMTARIKSDTGKWEKMIKASGVRLE